eukprot:5542318-Prymnesium_polylepis.1
MPGRIPRDAAARARRELRGGAGPTPPLLRLGPRVGRAARAARRRDSVLHGSRDLHGRRAQ